MNTWLLDLDRDFMTLLNARRLKVIGKELYEDKFVVKKLFFMRTVVDPFSAARYFADPYRVPHSTHFTISKPEGRDAIQHRLLVEFLSNFEPPRHSIVESVGKDCRVEIGFPDGVRADEVKCLLALKEVEGALPSVLTVWPENMLAIERLVASLLVEAVEHEKTTSRFYSQPPEMISEFVDRGYRVTKNVARIRAGVDQHAEMLVERMQDYWSGLDKIIARSLSNFITLCHVSAMRELLQLLASVRHIENLIPERVEPWIYQLGSTDTFRQVFSIDQPIAYAKVYSLSGSELSFYRVYWGPESEVIDSAKRREGDPVTGTWIDKYLYPQNELHLLNEGSSETFRYTEDVGISKVTDSSGQERA